MGKFSPGQSNILNLNGVNIFYRYRAGSSNVFLSFLHGYPTSSLDYEQIIEDIPGEYHVLAHDHLGFGQSDKPISHEYLLSDQADLTCKLYATLGAKKIHIIAHDYGTSVATEIIARHNEGLIDFDLCSVTLCNGSMLIELAKLRIIQRLLKSRWIGRGVARLSSESTFHRNMKNIWFDRSLYRQQEMNMHWQLLTSGNGRRVLSKVTRYIDQRYTYYDRWIEGLKNSNLPIHVLWAENDPVAVVAMAYKLDLLIQNSTLSIIKECGHYPMLEKGKEWLNLVVTYIQELKDLHSPQ